MATAIMATIVNTPAMLLKAGSHAGTGTPAGMPPHEPKMIKIQKARTPR